tara:strand:+ start:274 stop:552 length:279 start_codon:yes stop_codon:yes gene_type:complete
MPFGPGSEMQKSTRGNRALLGNRKSLKDLRSENGSFSSGELKFKEPTKKEFETFQKRHQLFLKKERLRRLLSFGLVVIIGLIFIYFMFIYKL